jgi:predicted AlkP superfamily pyrophosphatase or phosphodiesterase
MSTGLVEAVYTQDQFLKNDPPQDRYFPLFRNSFFQPRSPHVIVLLKKYIYIDNRPGGTGHGTPYDYDRHVPIVFMGPGIKPGNYDQPCGPEDIAPTLAALLGLDYPKESDSRLLTEMTK